ncbi:hypothetical protein [Filimonas effusa]|uniref:BON domain-containing protein n=1 Tax=Filimonas effusa TaxID=2508721 RepID=A0A4Q1DC95_9BACT|nr:hypothetical protein [Filimonas effusa]RXK87062.1 hypothetical protein ESB13_09830 [Filimonas effusa]
MSSSDFDKHSEELQEKVRLSREAFEIATQLGMKLRTRFQIADLNVAATIQQELVITGRIKSETEREEIMQFLYTEMPGWHINLNLSSVQE